MNESISEKMITVMSQAAVSSNRLRAFLLEDAGMVLVRGVKDIGDIKGKDALKEACDLGLSIT